jgi:hypothetical protein
MDDHYRTEVISGVGHPRSDLVMPLVLRTLRCAKAGAPALYYKSFGTVSSLLRKGNISSRPYCETITVTHDDKHILYYIYHLHDNYHLIMLHVFYK